MDDPLGTGRSDQMNGSQRIGCDDRRSNQRYPIALNVRWKVVHGREILDSGTGTTVDLSSAGLLIETDREPRAGLNIQASIAWPVLLRDVVPLQLVISGEVVRVVGRRVAARVRHHEFRTVALTRRGDAGLVKVLTRPQMAFGNS